MVDRRPDHSGVIADTRPTIPASAAISDSRNGARVAVVVIASSATPASQGSQALARCLRSETGDQPLLQLRQPGRIDAVPHQRLAGAHVGARLAQALGGV